MKASVALWRIAKNTDQYAAGDMTGGGAKITGGRWNSKHIPVIYASTSIALATLETLAHIGDNIVARNRILVRIDVPVSVWNERAQCHIDDLDPAWLSEPPGKTSVWQGDAWIKSRASALLMVPSVIVPEEWNVLVNPAHPAAKKIKASVIRQYLYDPRLC